MSNVELRRSIRQKQTSKRGVSQVHDDDSSRDEEKKEDVAEEEQDDSSRDEDEEEAEEDGEVESDNEYRGPWNNYTREELYNKWKNEVEKRKQFLDKAKTSEKELGKKKNKVESLELANKNLECENRSFKMID